MAVMKLKVAWGLVKNQRRKYNSLDFKSWPPDSKHSAISLKILSDVSFFPALRDCLHGAPVNWCEWFLLDHLGGLLS